MYTHLKVGLQMGILPLSSFSSTFPAKSLWCAIFGEIIEYVTIFLKSSHRGSHIIPSSWLVHAGCLCLAFTRLGQCKDFFSVQAMDCKSEKTRPQFILSSKRVLGNGVRTHVNSKGKHPLYWRPRGGLNLRHCMTQDSKPNTLLTEQFWSPYLCPDSTASRYSTLTCAAAKQLWHNQYIATLIFCFPTMTAQIDV